MTTSAVMPLVAFGTVVGWGGGEQIVGKRKEVFELFVGVKVRVLCFNGCGCDAYIRKESDIGPITRRLLGSECRSAFLRARLYWAVFRCCLLSDGRPDISEFSGRNASAISSHVTRIVSFAIVLGPV